MMKPTPGINTQIRVAAYCRAAGSGEDQTAGLETQRAYFTERITSNPDWIMAGIFSDASDCRSECPEFQKMLCECRQKKIDLILTKSISRFSRSMADCLDKVRELRELGVAVYFEQENLNTLSSGCDQYISIMGAITKAESESISRHICNGRFPCMVECRRTKRTWKKTIHLPGLPKKKIILRVE